MADEKVILVSEINQRLAAIREEITRLELEREFLLALRTKGVRLNGRAGRTDVAGRAVISRGGQSGGLTGAVMSLLRQAPGLTVGEVADRLEGRVSTNATNVRRVIASTLYNLHKNLRLTKDAAGRFRLPAERGGDR